VPLAALEQHGRVLHAKARLDDEVMMPSVRAYMLHAAAAEHGTLVRSQPDADGLEGFDGKDVELWVATEHEEEALAATLQAVPDVATVAVSEIVHAAPADAPARPEAAVDAPAVREAGAAKRKDAGAQTVRVQADRLDQLMHLMGELVVHRTHVEALAAQVDVPGLQQAMQDLTRSSQALQTMVMQVRMIPVEAVFLRFPRLVRDLSTKLEKQVELVLTGKDTELDRTVVDALGDPLVHLVRNSLDHGLESPQERVAAGKPETGILEIGARHAGGNVVITVRDDGRGVDPERVARRAAERGLIAAESVSQVDTARAIELLFEPGFSTAEQTSDISGRGVGMDAVREAIRGLGGEVLMTSEQGKGTTAQIRLPLTLAIMSALLVEASDLPFAIPLDRVERTLKLDDHPVRSVAGAPMLMLRDGVLPLVDLSQSLGYARGEGRTHAVVVRAGEQRLTLAVDRLVGQHELVTRPLPADVGSGHALSGGAVLSNGSIALIVDCDALGDRTRSGAVQLAATN
jgi:two-component system chemotaxis sensor kinase CheA